MGDLENSLVETIDNADLKDITNEILEEGIDSFLSDGVLKEIPIIKSFIGFMKLGKSIRDLFLFEKLLRFLFEIKSTTVDERRKLISKLEQEKSFNNKVGESLIFLLDRLDSLSKANIIGKLFKALIYGRIDSSTFQRLCFCVDRVYIKDIVELRKIKKGQFVNNEAKNLLYISGLLNRPPLGEIQFNSENEFKINEIGNILIFELYNE